VFEFFVDATVIKTWHGKGTNFRGLAPFSGRLLSDGERASSENIRPDFPLKESANMALRGLWGIQFGVSPAAFPSSIHLAISRARCASSCFGVVPSGSWPSGRRRLRISSLFAMVAISV